MVKKKSLTRVQEEKKPEVYDVGLESSNSKTVIVSAVLETTGQIRFGDGTEVNLTITEKDLLPVLKKTDGGYKTDFIEKVVFAGSKRRGVDRRAIHLLRNRYISSYSACYIPNLCLKCPSCWLYGATAMGEADYNIKSRVLYAAAYSVEPSEIAVVSHSRNMVDEKTHATAGEAGIHEEEFIKGGIHFPTVTVLDHVVDWEIGMFAHALIENVNQNKYTAASGRQGGIKFADANGKKLIVVDISPEGIFPIETVKVSAEITGYDKVVQYYKDAINLDKIKEMFKTQGFGVQNKDKMIEVKKNDKLVWKIIANEDELSVVQVTNKKEKELMKRIFGDKAYGYLKEKAEEFRQFLQNFKGEKWALTHENILRSLGVEEKKVEAERGEEPEESS